MYIIRCTDGTYYTGITKNPAARIAQHLSGECSYTSKHPPKKIVYLQPCDDYRGARNVELYIKHRGARRFLLDKHFREEWDYLQDIPLFT